MTRQELVKAGLSVALCGTAFGAAVVPLTVGAQASDGEDSQAILTIDHYVAHESTVPAIAGDVVQLYVRERVKPATMLRESALAERVVLFVHGAGTPAEVAFDVPYRDYSWMAYLAEAGFDVFSVDMTGYGRSTRPSVMNDACNLSAEQQAAIGAHAAPCKGSYAQQLTTIESDWADIDEVVDYVRNLRQVERVSLIGWSLGGPRAGGYAAQHPGKVAKLVLLAPAYSRDMAATPPAKNPAEGAAFNAQSHADFVANWDRQVGCEDQYDPAASDSVWSQMLASDPVGATWGQGVRRAPNTTVWGWGPAAVGRSRTPTLMVAAIHDQQITPDRVRALYEDLGAEQKVLIDLGCSSHAAMWERNHLLLFRASLEWLTAGSVDGMQQGVVRLGY
ncbi:MAG TPA: alpha/beta fold hydrolase [Gammaproteobacteria bacterium]|nr:alpha/beta fold hydrolase [Gammaproteobacteria bacterium]